MHCENCGNKIIESHSYCANCGKQVGADINSQVSPNINTKSLSHLKTKWWYRLIKVIYLICLAISLLFVVLVSYSINSTSDGSAFGYSFLSIIITLAIYEVIRRGFYYIALGKLSPQK